MASQRVMPILVLNLGAEMIYILNQRLIAQGICEEKQNLVRRDVIMAMFSKEFVAELIKPKSICSVAEGFKIFESLAHASIMKLNSNSMSKLYELMTMGVKYQMLSCPCPQYILHVTNKHIDVVKSICTDKEVRRRIDEVRETIGDLYAELTEADFQEIKESIALFFLDRKIRVSVLLKGGQQNENGTFRIRIDGPVPKGTEVPGIVRRFVNGKVKIESCPVVSRSIVETSSEPISKRVRDLGSNMYEIESEVVALDAVEDDGSDPSTDADVEAEKDKTTRATLALLSTIVGRKRASSSEANETFKIDFSAGGVTYGGGGGTAFSLEADTMGSKTNIVETVRISADEGSRSYRRDLDSFGSKWDLDSATDHSIAAASKRAGYGGAGSKDSPDDDEEDLLAMMDSASGK